MHSATCCASPLIGNVSSRQARNERIFTPLQQTSSVVPAGPASSSAQEVGAISEYGNNRLWGSFSYGLIFSPLTGAVLALTAGRVHDFAPYACHVALCFVACAAASQLTFRPKALQRAPRGHYDAAGGDSGGGHCSGAADEGKLHDLRRIRCGGRRTPRGWGRPPAEAAEAHAFYPDVRSASSPAVCALVLCLWRRAVLTSSSSVAAHLLLFFVLGARALLRLPVLAAIFDGGLRRPPVLRETSVILRPPPPPPTLHFNRPPPLTPLPLPLWPSPHTLFAPPPHQVAPVAPSIASSGWTCRAAAAPRSSMAPL